MNKKITEACANYFYLGANLDKEAIRLINQDNQKYPSILLYEESAAKNYQDALNKMISDGRARCIDSSAILMPSDKSDIYYQAEREKIIRTVLNDFNIFLLRSRYIRIDFEGAYKGLTYFSDSVDYAIKLSKIAMPRVVYCSYTPHTVESWIIVKTFEALGARVIRLCTSALPWILLPIQGLTNSSGCLIQIMHRQVRIRVIKEYLEALRGSYVNAAPYYLISPKKSLKSRLNLMPQFHPKKIVKYLQRLILRKEHQEVATKIPTDMLFGIFFLHYQPEMNTVPEAGFYCDQFQAIKKIAASLPDGVSLWVKEHPTSFQYSDRRWRPKGFYRRLIKLPNVHICSAEDGAFDLIDLSCFVASISGSCLLEALARGKPAITFFPARFNGDLDGVITDANSISVEELRNRLIDIVNGLNIVDQNRLLQSLTNLAEDGYDGALDDEFLPESDAQSSLFSRRSGYMAIKDVILGRL